jgi:hypothetical protein
MHSAADGGAVQAGAAGRSAREAPLTPQPAVDAAMAATAAEAAWPPNRDIAGSGTAEHDKPDPYEQSDREDSSPEELAAAVAASQQWPRVIRSASVIPDDVGLWSARSHRQQ